MAEDETAQVRVSGTAISSAGGSGTAVGKKQGMLSNPVPAYFAVLLLALGLFGGYAAMVLMNGAKDCPSCPVCPGAQDTNQVVKVKLVYYEKCGICGTRNSIMDVFDAKGVDYAAENIEASSEKGKLLVAEFGVTSAPTALVEARYISNYPQIKAAMDGMFQLKGGYYLVPESNLNTGKSYSSAYLAKLDPTCTNEPGKYEVLYFSDPYNPFAITQKVLFDRDLNALGNAIRLKYQFVRANSFGSDANVQAKVTLAGNYLLCAQQQGKFSEMEHEILAIFCDIVGGDTLLTNEELMSCSISSHAKSPLEAWELKKALSRVKDIDTNSFMECVAAGDLIGKSDSRAKAYGISGAPSVVVGCTYFTDILGIGKAVCDLNSSLQGCPK